MYRDTRTGTFIFVTLKKCSVLVTDPHKNSVESNQEEDFKKQTLRKGVNK